MASLHKTKEWERKANYIRQRDGYLCRECIRQGKRQEAKEVHHVNPLSERTDLAFDNRNLITLCSACHNKMEDRVNGGLTKAGEKLRERINRKQGIR